MAAGRAKNPTGIVIIATMIEITPNIEILENEIHYVFIRASGPGGQNVNKVASAVQLRFDIKGSSLNRETKSRLIKLAGNRIVRGGIIIIDARRYRTQKDNKEDALARLKALIKKASVKPRSRKKTKPTTASKEKRLKAKKLRAEIKRIRQSKSPD